MPRRHSPCLNRFRQSIHNEFARTISLAARVTKASVSVAQLERHGKEVFQLTPRQQIHQARLAEASRLLLEHEFPTTEIALRCGYTNHSVFSRQASALTERSPSPYRKTNRTPR